MEEKTTKQISNWSIVTILIAYSMVLVLVQFTLKPSDGEMVLTVMQWILPGIILPSFLKVARGYGKTLLWGWILPQFFLTSIALILDAERSGFYGIWMFFGVSIGYWTWKSFFIKGEET